MSVDVPVPQANLQLVPRNRVVRKAIYGMHLTRVDGIAAIEENVKPIDIVLMSHMLKEVLA